MGAVACESHLRKSRMVEISLSGSGEGPGEQSPGLLYHPHAVTSAGGDSFGYDAVGNQFARP